MLRARFLASIFLAAALPLAVQAQTAQLPAPGTRQVTVADPNTSLDRAHGAVEADDHGCAAVRDTASDAAPCVTATLAAAAPTGRRAHFRAGKYSILSAVALPATAVWIDGDGWDEFGPSGHGTWFHVGGPGFTPFLSTGPAVRGLRVSHVGFSQAQPAPAPGWAPTAYPPVFDFQGYTSAPLFDDVMVWGVYRFARFANVDRLHVRRLWGEPFLSALEIDAATDSARVEGVHFWPFWATNASGSGAGQNAAIAGVVRWQAANGTPIISRRNDNPHFSNLFVFGYKAGIEFGANTGSVAALQGPTSRFHASNLDIDATRNAILVTGAGTSGQVVNLSWAGSDFPAGLLGGTNPAIPGGSAIELASSNAQIDVVNLRASNAGRQVVHVGVSSGRNDVTVANLRAETWSQEAAGYYAVDCAYGNRCRVQGAYYAGGNGPQSSPWVAHSPVELLGTTDGTSTAAQLTTDGAAPAQGNGIFVPASGMVTVQASVVGRDAATNDAYAANVTGAVRRIGGTLAVLPGSTVTVTGRSAGAANFNAALAVDAARQQLALLVYQPAGGNPVQWRAQLTTLLPVSAQ